jgi:hypothetical protein
MGTGAYLHLAEAYDHEHRHEPIEHEHRHVHNIHRHEDARQMGGSRTATLTGTASSACICLIRLCITVVSTRDTDQDQAGTWLGSVRWDGQKVVRRWGRRDPRRAVAIGNPRAQADGRHRAPAWRVTLQRLAAYRSKGEGC